MRRRVLKLVFCVAVLLFVRPYGTSVVRATNDNWCYCDPVAAYVYYNGPGGFWTYLDEILTDGSVSLADNEGPGYCADTCYYLALYYADQLCDAYPSSSYPQSHYQISFWWYFSDPDDDSGGDQQGDYNSLPSALMCP
jgi:hypothetical protein